MNPVEEAFKELDTALVRIETPGCHYVFPGLRFGGYRLVLEQMRRGTQQVTFLNGEGGFLSIPARHLKRIVLVSDKGEEGVLWQSES